MLVLGGEVLPTYLGWGTSAPATVVIAMMLGFGFTAGTAAMAALGRPDAARVVPSWVRGVGVAVNICSGVLVGGFLLGVVIGTDSQLNGLGAFFAAVIFVAGMVALVLCARDAVRDLTGAAPGERPESHQAPVEGARE